MKRSLANFLVVLFSVTLMFPLELHAQDCKPIAKSRAISVAQKTIKGKVLSASLSKRGGRQMYKVKVLLDNGRVKTISVDACTGRATGVND